MSDFNSEAVGESHFRYYTERRVNVSAQRQEETKRRSANF